MSQDQQDQNLMLGDRINWPYILGNGVMKFQNSVVQIEGSQSEQEVREAALVLFYSIPDVWIVRDPQLKIDLENSIDIVEEDTRREFMGRKIGKPKIEKMKILRPYRLYNACVNVFQRKGLLSKTIYNENIVPTPETLEQGEEDEKPVTSTEQKELDFLKKQITET